jgi:hypothetical protein
MNYKIIDDPLENETLITWNSQSARRKVRVTQLAKKFLNFCKLQGSLSCSQDATTEPCPEAAESNPCSHNSFPYGTFIIVHPSTTCTSCMISPYKIYACTSPICQVYYVNYTSKYPQNLTSIRKLDKSKSC